MKDDTIFIIQQGEQLFLQFIVEDKGVAITPENCTAMRIFLDDIVFEGEDIEYFDNCWNCFITQTQSLHKSGRYTVQAQWKYTYHDKTIIRKTEKKICKIECSEQKEEW